MLWVKAVDQDNLSPLLYCAYQSLVVRDMKVIAKPHHDPIVLHGGLRGCERKVFDNF
jgi:hypothetical protein